MPRASKSVCLTRRIITASAGAFVVLFYVEKMSLQGKVSNTVVVGLKRWHSLHKGTLFTQQYDHGETISEYAVELAERSAEAYSRDSWISVGL
ncbi:hypothetical protein [Marinomonas sp. 2405UD68-3]|uniref:hypothetical protein n=1 Tax=Marinomonas sp. 2405UD68-3 TaxID=3391835 RepID=UPI0039C8D7B6